jgi:two-component system, OmpR family, response regulator
MLNAPKVNPVEKVLIVEDEGEMCLLLNILLDAKDMELEHVKYLSDAIEYLKEQKPAVVLLDNKLPDGYGVDFISYIKLNYPSTKVLMISGFDASVKDVAIANGADMFLEKPFNRQQIKQSVADLLNQAREN